MVACMPMVAAREDGSYRPRARGIGAERDALSGPRDHQPSATDRLDEVSTMHATRDRQGPLAASVVKC